MNWPPTWDAGVTCGAFTCCAATLVPIMNFNKTENLEF